MKKILITICAASLVIVLMQNRKRHLHASADQVVTAQARPDRGEHIITKPVESKLQRRPSGMIKEPIESNLKARFGDEATFAWTEDGRITQINTVSLADTEKDKSFSLQDAATIKVRALSILESLKGELGIENVRWAEPVIRPGQATAQVFFEQLIDGLPLVDHGSLRMDFSSQGELMGLYSDLSIGTVIANSKDNSISDREKVRPVIFTQDGKAYYAVEYFDQGVQIIEAAQSHQKLLRKNKTQH